MLASQPENDLVAAPLPYFTSNQQQVECLVLIPPHKCQPDGIQEMGKYLSLFLGEGDEVHVAIGNLPCLSSQQTHYFILIFKT